MLGELRGNFASGCGLGALLPESLHHLGNPQHRVEGVGMVVGCANSGVQRGSRKKVLRVCENSQRKIWQLPIPQVGTQAMLVKFISCPSYQPLFIQDTNHDLEQKLPVSEVRVSRGGEGAWTRGSLPRVFEGRGKSIFSMNPQFPHVYVWEGRALSLKSWLPSLL